MSETHQTSVLVERATEAVRAAVDRQEPPSSESLAQADNLVAGTVDTFLERLRTLPWFVERKDGELEMAETRFRESEFWQTPEGSARQSLAAQTERVKSLLVVSTVKILDLTSQPERDASRLIDRVTQKLTLCVLASRFLSESRGFKGKDPLLITPILRLEEEEDFVGQTVRTALQVFEIVNRPEFKLVDLKGGGLLKSLLRIVQETAQTTEEGEKQRLAFILAREQQEAERLRQSEEIAARKAVRASGSVLPKFSRISTPSEGLPPAAKVYNRLREARLQQAGKEIPVPAQDKATPPVEAEKRKDSGGAFSTLEKERRREERRLAEVGKRTREQIRQQLQEQVVAGRIRIPLVKASKAILEDLVRRGKLEIENLDELSPDELIRRATPFLKAKERRSGKASSLSVYEKAARVATNLGLPPGKRSD